MFVQVPPIGRLGWAHARQQSPDNDKDLNPEKPDKEKDPTMTNQVNEFLDSLPDGVFYVVKINEAIARLNSFYSSSAPVPMVTWDLNGTSRLGEASGDGTTIRLNRQYADAMGRQVYLTTALHEACHIVTTWRCNAVHARHDGQWSAHGYQWSRAMEVLGLSPDRCASAAELTPEVRAQVKPARTVRKVHASCACTTGHEVTVAVANKVKSGARYTCRGCRQRIVIEPTDAEIEAYDRLHDSIGLGSGPYGH